MSRDLFLWFATTVMMTMAAGGPLRAQPAEVPLDAREIERIDLPANRQEEWPDAIKTMKPVAREEFARLWQSFVADRRATPEVSLPAARYRGVLRGRDLVGSEFALTVNRPPGAPAWMELSPWKPALSQVRWTDGAAIWGRVPDGSTWLATDRPRAELTGRWSLRGDLRGEEIHFEWQSPKAAITLLELEIPANSVLTTDSGDARRLPSTGTDGTSVWELSLGPRSEAHFSIGPSSQPLTTRPRVLIVEQQILSVVSEGDLSFQSIYPLEVHEAPVQVLNFDLPAGVEVFSASLGGEIPLDWSVSTTDSRRQLSVRLPDPVQGRVRVVLDGIAILKPGQAVSAPQILLRDADFVTGLQEFTISPPLQIRSIRGTAFRQQTPVMKTKAGDSLRFQMLAPDGQVLLELRRPQATLTTQVFGHLLLGSDDWSSVTDVVWSATDGVVFQTACRIPDHWEVSDVQPAPWVPDSRLASWDVQTGAGGASTLSLEFYEAITPGSPRGVRIYLRRAAPSLPATSPPPVPLATDGELDEFGLEVAVPPSLSVFPGDNSNLNLLPPATLPDGWQGTAAGLSAETRPAQTIRRFRCEQRDLPGELKIEWNPGPETLGSEATVEASPTAIAWNCTLRVRRELQPDSPVRWYVGGSPPAIDWSVNGTSIPESSLRRIPVERHVDWKLPETGTLWEWHPPPGTEDELAIVGTATLRWSKSVEIPLVLLPELTGGVYRLTLLRTAPEVVDYDDQGLSLESFVDTPLVGSLPDDSREDRRVWRYDSPEDRLLLTRKEAVPAAPDLKSASLVLTSLLSADADGADLHRAELRVSGQDAGAPLVVTLPTGARLLDLRRNGDRQSSLPQDRTVRIPLGRQPTRHLIQLVYETPATAGFLRQQRIIAPPQLDCAVSLFRWQFSVPPQTRVASAPAGVMLAAPLPADGWARRLLGPLGRAAGESLFNPLSGAAWRQLWPEDSVEPNGIGFATAEVAVPDGWTSYVGLSSTAPTAIVLETWNGLRLQSLEWIILFGVTLFGLVMRIVRLRRRHQLAAVWLGLACTASICGPAPLAPLAGSACAGMLLAILAPRSLLAALRWDAAPLAAASAVPGGSTQSFQYTPPAVAFLLTVWLSAAAAQPPIVVGSADTPSERRSVYVLVDEDLQPSRRLPLVYLDSELLRQLRQHANRPAGPPWLLTSAEYDVTLAADLTAEVKAVFLATALSADRPGVLELPVAGGSLKNRDGCRVNGLPVVALRSPDETGWLIPLPADLPAGDLRPLRIELDLLTSPSTTADAAVALQIPAVAASTATLRWPAGAPWTVATRRGSSSELPGGNAVKVQLGAVDELRVIPVTAAPAEPADVQLDVKLSQTVDCRSAWSEVRFRCRCSALQGNLRTLRLQAPPTAVVREIRGDALSGYRVIRSETGRHEVLLSFQPEERKQWLLEGTLLIPQNPAEVERSIPLVQPVSAEHVQISRITTTCLLGSSPDHRIELREADDPAMTPITADAFLQTWGETGLTVGPQLTFEIRPGSGNPSFRLTNAIVQRRALRWNQTGTIRPRRMEWVVQGELETTGGAWSHALLVDRRLRIESISVEENGAERLLQRTESRLSNTQLNRVVLFLSERTSGLQNLTIRATGPVRAGAQQALPGIYCEGAVLIDGRISLYCDPNLMLEMPSIRGLARLESSVEAAADAEAPTLFGRFQVLDPDASATLRVVSRLGRCSARHAMIMTPAEQDRWRLSGRLELTPADPAARELACDLPADWGSRFEFTVEGARAEAQVLPTGLTRLVLQRVGSMTDPVRLNYGVELSTPPGREWAIALPQPQQCPQMETVIGIPGSDIWEASPEQGVIRDDVAPEWLHEFSAGWSQVSELTLVRPRRDALLLVRRAPPAERVAREIPFVEQRLRLISHDEIAGATLLFVRPGTGSLDIRVPAEIQLTSALEGDRPLSIAPSGPEQVRLELEAGGSTSVVLLNWSRRLSTGWFPIEQRVETLPVVVGVIPQQHWVSIEAGGNDWLWARAGIARRTGLDQALGRLEALLQIKSPEPLPAWQNALLQATYAQLTAAIPTAIETGGELLPAQLQRWNRIVETINARTVRIAPLAAGSGQIWQTAATVPRGVSGEVSSLSGDLRLWQVRREELLLWLALPLGALLLPLLWRWLRLPYAEWLHSRPALSWLLLGALWWLWLTPSVLGLPLLVAGVWRAFRRRPAEVAGTLVG